MRCGSTSTISQSRRSHHDLNLTLTYAAESTPERVSSSFAITAEFMTGERSFGSFTDDVEQEAHGGGDEAGGEFYDDAYDGAVE